MGPLGHSAAIFVSFGTIFVFQCFKLVSSRRSHSLQTHSSNIYFASVLHKSLSNMEAI